MVSVRHDFHIREFPNGQAYLTPKTWWKVEKQKSILGSTHIFLVLVLMSFGWCHSLYHILSLDLIFYLWPRWSILIFDHSFVHFKAFKEGTNSTRTILPLACEWFLLHPQHLPNLFISSPPRSLLSLLPFALVHQQKVLSLNLVLPLYHSYSFQVPPCKSHNLSIHRPILGALKTRSPENSLNCFCYQHHHVQTQVEKHRVTDKRRTDTRIWALFFKFSSVHRW